MRKTLLVLAAFAMTMAASAQSFTPKFANKVNPTVAAIAPATAGAHVQNGVAARKAPATRKANLAANQRLIGYYTTDEVDNMLGLPSYPGPSMGAAMLQPAHYQPYIGAKVVGVRFAPGNNTTVNGVFVYSLDAQGQLTVEASKDTTFASKTTMSTINYVITPSWETIMLPEDQQFTLSSTPAAYLVGYAATQDSTNYPFATNRAATGDFYMYVNFPAGTQSGPGWYNFGSDYGAIAVQLLVEGDFPQNGITPQDFGSMSLAVGKTKTVPVTFDNMGSSLANFDYTVTVGDQTSAEQHVTLATPLTVGGSTTQNITFSAPDTPGTYAVTLTVTKVNGEANGATTTAGTGTMNVVSREVPRKVVMEEFTGTGCGWCPRGFVGMAQAAKAYPDNFIGIGIHQYNSQGDNMYNANYANLGFNSAPSCMLDRSGATIDPYYGSENSILDDIAARLEDVPVVGVDIESATFSADSSQVEIKTSIDPLVSGNYNVAYVITADSLHSTASGWVQGNNYGYYQSTGDENLDPLCSAGQTYSPWFCDVLISSSYSNTTNQAPQVTLTAETPAATTYTLSTYNGRNTTAMKAVLRYDQVYAVVILLDPTTGHVVNAAKKRVVTAAEVTGISGVNASNGDATPAAIYNAAGQQVGKMSRGLNIIKLSNGKTVKVIRK